MQEAESKMVISSLFNILHTRRSPEFSVTMASRGVCKYMAKEDLEVKIPLGISGGVSLTKPFCISEWTVAIIG